MFQKIPLAHWFAAVLTLGAAHACYYYYYIEDPNNFAYRYCSVGVRGVPRSVCASCRRTNGAFSVPCCGSVAEKS